jgi:SOS response associated peptidase (SRAP)
MRHQLKGQITLNGGEQCLCPDNFLFHPCLEAAHSRKKRGIEERSVIVFADVRSLPIVAAEADHRGALRVRCVGCRLEPVLQHCADAANPGDLPASQGTDSADFIYVLGPNSALGKRPFDCGGHDQREIGDSRHESRFSRSAKIPKVPDSDGFYEWKRNGGSKQPYRFEINGGELFAFAGL